MIHWTVLRTRQHRQPARPGRPARPVRGGRRISIAVAGLMAVSAMYLAVAPAPAEAAQCVTQRFNGVGKGQTKRAAMLRARIGWSGVVELRKGPAWKVWNISKRRRTRCYRNPPGAPQGQWVCYRSATPCLLAVE